MGVLLFRVFFEWRSEFYGKRLCDMRVTCYGLLFLYW